MRRDFHLLAVVLPKLAEAARRAGDDLAFDAVIEELIGQGGGSKAEIAYAAIVSGYYDDPLILECVRDMLTSDSDLRDLASAFLPEGTAAVPVERVRAIAGRAAQSRAAPCPVSLQRLRHRQLAIPLALPGLPFVGHAARDRGARIPAARRAAALARRLTTESARTREKRGDAGRLRRR